MKRISTLLSFICLIASVLAQSPNRMSYQAVIRNSSNALVTNTAVGMRISIIQGAPNGSAVYVETQLPTTNANGLASLEIGAGSVVSGNVATINWANGPYFIKTETDVTGGANYTISGTSQLLSVPYAFFAENCGNGFQNGTLAGQILYWDGVSWIILNPGTQSQVLTICNGMPVWTTGGNCIGTITTLSCATATHNGVLTQGVNASGVNSIITYNGGNGAPHNGDIVNSTGVTGLTATLSPGTFASGSGSLTYTITGTPSSSGTASFVLNIGGQTCVLTRTVNLPAGTLTTLDCATALHNGSLTSGVPATGVNSIVTYSGSNGGTHNGQTVLSTGVTGLTATLPSGNFVVGSGSLTYTITGTPSSSGTASFVLNIGGQTCVLTRTVNLPAGTLTTLDCATATHNGVLTSGVPATGVNSIVTYSGSNGGTHNGQTVTSTGVTGLTATLPSGNFAVGSGSLTYTITGTPSSSGTASFLLNIGGQTCVLTRTVNLPAGTLTTLDCATALHNGSLTSGVPATGVNSIVTYSGSNGGTHNGQTVLSTGVTGLTATLPSGNFVVGSGSLTYTITGTPSSSGTASFVLNVGGQTCVLTRIVSLPVGSITTIDCATATHNGILTSGVPASGVNSIVAYSGGNGGTHNGQTVSSTGVTGLTATLSAGNFAVGSGSLTYTITGTPSGSGTASFVLNIGGQTCVLTRTVNLPSGTISSLNCPSATQNGILTAGVLASGVNSVVAYTGGNGGTHNGQTVSSTGVTGLTATLAAGAFAVGSGSLTYTITGTPNASGTASFVLNIGGQSCILTRSVSAGYPAGTVHCNGIPTAVVEVTNPITGKTWMDRNLGATQVATSSTDNNGYGDLYQWGRRADGHQCRNSATTSTLSSTDIPPHGNFILSPNAPYDWRTTPNNNLWQGVNGINNPCPIGFRIPTNTEFDNERLSWSNNNSVGAFSSILKLPLGGTRGYDGIISSIGTYAAFNTSTISTAYVFSLDFYPTNALLTTGGGRGYGRSTRCIKN